MWLRRVDDETGVDPVTLVEASDIGQHTRGFPEAARLLGCVTCVSTDRILGC